MSGDRPPNPLAQLRAAVTELGDAVAHLREVAESQGQGDDALPLILSDDNEVLRDAVNRELAAHQALRRALDHLKRED